jgi:hypothetical protein
LFVCLFVLILGFFFLAVLGLELKAFHL